MLPTSLQAIRDSVGAEVREDPQNTIAHLGTWLKKRYDRVVAIVRVRLHRSILNVSSDSFSIMKRSCLTLDVLGGSCHRSSVGLETRCVQCQLKNDARSLVAMHY